MFTQISTISEILYIFLGIHVTGLRHLVLTGRTASKTFFRFFLLRDIFILPSFF